MGRADEVCFLGGPRRIPQKYPDFQLEDELDIEGGEMSCGATPTAGAGKISNILPISNICPIGNIFPISDICPIDNIFPIGNI